MENKEDSATKKTKSISLKKIFVKKSQKSDSYKNLNDDVEVIKFYRPGDKYGEFSNFYPSEIVINERKYATVEHYFQSQKYKNKIITTNNKIIHLDEFIRKLSTPYLAFKHGRMYDIRDDWEEVKDNIMQRGILAKFTQNEKLKKLLLKTENAKLVENSPTDDYWGTGKNGKGKNKLGKLLMSLRTDLASSV